MAHHSNRFALLEEDDENLSRTAETRQGRNNPTGIVAADDNDNPWQEVKRGGQRQKGNLGGQLQKPPSGVQSQSQSQSQSQKPLINRPETKPFTLPTRAKQTRDISGSTQGSAEGKGDDPHENWCGVCHMKFPNKAALQNHVKHAPQHQHYCNLCKRVFKDRNGLKNHVDNSLGHEVFCNICLSAFKDEWGLKNHFENNYSVGHEFVCLTCLLGFHRKNELEQHLRTGKKHVWCSTCRHQFRDQDERDAHWLTTTKHKHCMQPGCEFDAPNEDALQMHLKDDHYQCEGCTRICPSHTQLQRHQMECGLYLAAFRSSELEEAQKKQDAHVEWRVGHAKRVGHAEQWVDPNYHCSECGFTTHHKGNYEIHMTRHATAAFACWACDLPMRTYSGMINHLEAGKCPKLVEPMLLTAMLGKFWHSTLYMDLDIHAQIRRNTIDIVEMTDWMDQGLLHPFICRADGCLKTFNHLSSLVLHVESAACSWHVKLLRLDLLREEFLRVCLRRDSGVVS